MLGVGAGEGEGAVTTPLDSVVINQRLRREKAVMLSSWSEKYSPPVSRHKTDFYSSIAHNYVKESLRWLALRNRGGGGG